MPVPQSLKYGAFDEKKKRDIQDEERAKANPWPNPTPDIAPGSRKVSEPIFTGLGGAGQSQSANNALGDEYAADGGGWTEVKADKRVEQQNFLSNPTDLSSQFIDRAPERNTGGDYLKIMARDNQNAAAEDYNSRVVAKIQAEEASRQAQIANALRQEAAQQKMAIEAEDARRMQEFFAATGAVPSPQAAQEYLRQVGRQRASSQFMEAIKGLIVQKENEYKRLFQGYENTPEAELPAAIRMQAAALDRKYADIENKMAMAAGMQAGTNNPGNMADKENNPPIY